MKLTRKINRLAAIAGATLALSFGASSASAAFINGSISFSDGFSTIPTLVSTDTFFDINAANTDATATTDDFALFIVTPPAVDVAAAGDIDTLAPAGTLYEVGGFTFNFGNIVSDTSMALTCNLGLCLDSRTLQITGTVTGNGFDETAFVALWTANGACAGAGGVCTGGYSPTWSSSVVALGRIQVPAPGALLLMSLGLLGLAYQRRSKA